MGMLERDHVPHLRRSPEGTRQRSLEVTQARNVIRIRAGVDGRRREG
jgi:hypothetical protein